MSGQPIPKTHGPFLTTPRREFQFTPPPPRPPTTAMGQLLGAIPDFLVGCVLGYILWATRGGAVIIFFAYGIWENTNVDFTSLLVLGGLAVVATWLLVVTVRDLIAPEKPSP